MSDLVKYEPKIKIWFWGIGNEDIYVIADEKNRKAIEDEINNSKIVKIEGQTWNTSRFITIQKVGKINKIQEFILMQDLSVRKVIEKREKEMWQKVNHGFESIEGIKNFLNDKNIKYNNF